MNKTLKRLLRARSLRVNVKTNLKVKVNNTVIFNLFLNATIKKR